MATASSCELEVVSLLKVTDSSFDLTPEEEDVRYGPFDEIREVAVREIAASKGDVVFQAPLGEVYLELFWDGWQAAYLSSKRENASKGVASDFGNVKTTQQCAGRKRKFGETLSDEEKGEMFQVPMYDKEYVLAFLACSVLLAYNNWPALESVIGKIECDAVQENIFDCFAKFILSILDEEDMERIFYAHQIRMEHRKFYRKLISKDCFRDFAAGKLKNLQLRHLTESDIYNAYLMSLKFGLFRYLCVTGLPEKLKNTELIEKFKSRASQLIKEHRPLKGELKAQVLMELTRLKCFHVTDILILEAMHGLKLPELLERSVAGINLEDSEKLSQLVGDLADTMFDMTNNLSLMKLRQAVMADYGVTRPMFHIFMCFEDEVVNVLKIANYERRMENERFITLAHILTGLGCSRVADCVPEISRLASLRSYSGLFTFIIYQESFEFACQLDERVGLQHFVFALVYFHLEDELLKLATTPPTSDFFQRLKDCRACFVQGWRNVDVFTTILEKRCRAREYLKVKGSELVEKLAKDLKSGRVILPCDEDLRVPS